MPGPRKTGRRLSEVVLDLEVLPLGVFSAEVRGIDVLVFRDQRLTDDDLLSFSRHFGALDSPPNQGAGRKSPPGYPEVYSVSNVLDERGEPIGAWSSGSSTWISSTTAPTIRAATCARD